jgi:sugar lactone lactonase YvrE
MQQVSPDTGFLRAVFLTAVFIFLLSPAIANADAYGDARDELVAAYQATDYSAMRAAAHKALEARPGYPGARFNLSLAELLDNDPSAALNTLNGLVAEGIDYGAANMEEFAALQEHPGWAAYQAAVAKLHVPVGSAEIAYTYDVSKFVPEGIAINEDGELFLGSIHNGDLVRIGTDAEVISSAAVNEHWSVFGMRLDDKGGLWFASAAIPEYQDNEDETNGSTGLFRIDLKTRQITDRALLPAGDTPKVLGDLVFADANTIYTTESLTGVLYRYDIAEKEFTEVVPAGSLRSMQGLVLDKTGRFLYVADYVGGLFRIELASGDVTRVTADASVTLFGIDGLYRHGNELIVTHNGINPHRVAGLTLSDDGLAISEQRILAMNLPEFGEPTLGVVMGDDFYFVANSHWDRFDREGNLPDDLSPPIILRLPLN